MGKKAKSPCGQAFEVTTERIPGADGTFTDAVRYKCLCCWELQNWALFNPANCCLHWRRCKEIRLSELESIRDAGCKNEKLIKLINTKKTMESRALSATQSSGTVTAVLSTTSIAGPLGKRNAASGNTTTCKKQKALSVPTCTPSMATNILFFMTRFLLGCALSFNMVVNEYFRDMIKVLNPIFFQHYMPRSTYVFTHTYFDLVYEHVKRQAFVVLLRGNELRTLSADGLKAGLNKVINFTVGHAGRHMFKDCIYQGSQPDTAAYHAELYKKQLETDLDGSTLTATQVQSTYCAIISDNVDYMRHAGEAIEKQFPLTFALGCIAHLFDLLCEDFAKIGEIKEMVEQCYTIVLFCKPIPSVLEPFRKEAQCYHAFRYAYSHSLHMASPSLGLPVVVRAQRLLNLGH